MSNETLTISGDLNRFIDSDFDKKVAILTCMSGEQVGRRIMLADDHITLGRSPDATIMLQDTHVSRLHLTIQYDAENGGYRIRDLGSSNGTLLNETRITEAILRDGDKIIIGHTMLRFSWADALDLQFQDEIDHLINIDELTGLVVKRRFDEELNRFAAVAKKQGSCLVMMMMDMDGIKGINDTYGHTFGAYTISETGRIIKQLIGNKGLASRFGGDEFMAFIPNATIETARTIGEKIRQSVENHLYVKENIVLNPTICIGISALKPGDTLETLLKRADDALYQSKRDGRNLVRVSD
jgi:two-component system, cell cycle response regulator